MPNTKKKVRQEHGAQGKANASMCSSIALFKPSSEHETPCASLSKYLQDLIDNTHFSGLTVLLKQEEEILFKQAFGYANREEMISSTISDNYRIASATKPFISTLVIQLAREEKLYLDDTLSKYLDEKVIDGIENADRVTIRHLLGMQSGIYNYTDNPDFERYLEEHPHHQWTDMDALHFAKGMPADFEPGADTNYTNTNYILLGILLENITHKPLVELLDENIFKPLKLNNTYFETERTPCKPPVQAYVYEEGEYKNVSDINTGKGLADGGIVSNVEDLTCFIHHVMTDDKFMPQEWRKQLLDFHPMPPDEGEIDEYGLGWIRFPGLDEDIIGHDGSDDGYQSWMIYFPERQLSLVILANSNPPHLDEQGLLSELAKDFLPKQWHHFGKL